MIKPSVQQLSQFSYDPQSLRYRDLKTGRFVKAEAIRNAIDAVIASEAQAMRAISQQLIDGTINLAEWQLQMSARVKTLHVSMALVANGGVKNTSASDMGYIGSLVKKQYKFLRDFAKQIRRGDVPLNKAFLNRTTLYAESARITYHKVLDRRAKASNLELQEKNVLGSADHCKGSNSCTGQTAKGWVPIGTLVPIGSRLCQMRCHCRIEHRVKPA